MTVLSAGALQAPGEIASSLQPANVPRGTLQAEAVTLDHYMQPKGWIGLFSMQRWHDHIPASRGLHSHATVPCPSHLFSN